MDPQETIFPYIVIGIAFVSIIIFFFAISIIKQQKRTLQLQKENALAEISTMERERSRIAADLHDDVGPLLSVIKFQIDVVDSANEEDMAELKKAAEHIDGLVHKMREISINLMPTSLVRKGLVTAIDEFLSRVEKAGILKTHFTYTDVSTISQEKSINLFRICQEVVHNAIKHSRARNIRVDFKEEKNFYCLLIKDDGVGFDFPTRIKDSTGLGLRSLKNRAELMKGEMIVESKEKVGTAFLFKIPVGA
jgi:two-component system, NarL family, sensor kinase